MKAVVLKVSPKAEAKLDSCDAVYLKARFDSAIESFEEDESAIEDQRIDGENLDDDDNVKDGHNERVDALENRWKEGK